MNNLKRILFYFIVYVFVFIGLFMLCSSFYKEHSIYIDVNCVNAGSRPLEVYISYDEWGSFDEAEMVGFDSDDLQYFYHEGKVLPKYEGVDEWSGSLDEAEMVDYDLEGSPFFSYKGKIIPKNDNVKYIMIHFGDNPYGHADLNRVKYRNSSGYAEFTKSDIVNYNDVQFDDYSNYFGSLGSDPYIILKVPPLTPYKNYTIPFSIIASAILTFIVYKSVRVRAIFSMVQDLYESRELIFSLAKNDFKTKFAGSYFGILWAFVQPVCTILVFWFVFQVGFRSSDVGDVAFILWFIAGIIPWFFFSEAWNNGTTALMEYSYLVKKVVFKIHILPLVKIISALFVHMFFILFMFGFYLLYGEKPNVYWFQVLYYSGCMVLLVIALSYITSALVVFFKDLGQIMNIVLQFGMWLTPIMWSIDRIPEKFMWIFKFNPMYYIVQGYRDSLIYHTIFYNNIKQTLYFWFVLFLLMLAGCVLYKKLKPHFADVL